MNNAQHPDWLEATVYRSTGSWYVLKDGEGNFLNGRVRGKLKIDEAITSTNPIAIGDRVLVAPEDESSGQLVIKEILPRDNYIIRVSPHNQHQQHIVAANIDQAVLVTSLHAPRTSQGFVDRFLLTAEAYHVPCVIVVNKTDLLRDRDRATLEEWKDMYGAAGYSVVESNATDPGMRAQLSELTRGKTSLFSGHSGVGKSTLINLLLPGREVRTGEISAWSGKGLHTTTFAEMFDLEEGAGRIIDTPGVKEFGLIHIEREELAHYFPEIRPLIGECRFYNCLHISEPGCAVVAAVQAGNLHVERYVSYRAIFDSIEKKW